MQLLIIQVQIPRKRSGQSFVAKMKCQVSSSTSYEILINKEISLKSYEKICSGEPKKVNLGFNNGFFFTVENSSLLEKPPQSFIHGDKPSMAFNWEVLTRFFSTHNIEPNWLDCDGSWGYYDEELGRWTGCVGKV